MHESTSQMDVWSPSYEHTRSRDRSSGLLVCSVVRSFAWLVGRSVARAGVRSIAWSPDRSFGRVLGRSTRHSLGWLVVGSYVWSLVRSLALLAARLFVRSLDRSLCRSLNRLVARSVARSLARLFDRPFARSLGWRSVAPLFAKVGWFGCQI